VWIDDEGVLHTVALRDPTDVMTDEFRAGLDAIAASHRAALRGIVERAENRVYDADWFPLKTDQEVHIAAAPPVGLLQGRVVKPEDVTKAIDQVDARWRLDAIMALDDYLD
jgi:hypothetical protein